MSLTDLDSSHCRSSPSGSVGASGASFLRPGGAACGAGDRAGLRHSVLHSARSAAKPRAVAPIRATPTYRAKTRGLTSDHTATIAGTVVAGPAMRNASAAPGLMPPWMRPETIGSAAASVMYRGSPTRAASGTARGFWPPSTPAMASCGTYARMTASRAKATSSHRPSRQLSLATSRPTSGHERARRLASADLYHRSVSGLGDSPVGASPVAHPAPQD